MARTKHRKGHKEASARRSAYNRLMHRIENAGQPVEVGKNRFKVLPDFEEDVTVTVGGQTVPATITNEGTLRLESGPNKGDLLHVDYRPIEERVMAQMLGPENFIIQGRGAGKTRELKNFIAQAEAAGRAVLRADVLKQELRELHDLDPQQDGETVYVSVPKRQLQDVVDTTTMRSYSMGCDFGDPKRDSTVVVEHTPKRGPARITDYVSELRPFPEELKRLEDYPIPLAPPLLLSPHRWEDLQRGSRSAPEPPLVYPVTCEVCHHIANSREELCTHLWYPAPETVERAKTTLTHLEPAFQLDADGKPCGIKEISICPGPDPNGLTTLKSPEEPV